VSPPRAIFAHRPADLTVAWAQQVAETSSPGIEVSRLEIRSVDVGTTTRVRLAVAHDGPEGLPRRWFVKFPSMSRRARTITALPRLPQAEARFYREVARSVPVTCPPVLALQTGPGRGTTIVLADVCESGAKAGAAGDALSAEQAASVVEHLALLHAHHWEQPSLDREYRWLAGPIRRSEDVLGSGLAVPLMRRGLQLAGDAVPRTLRAPAMEFARRRRQVMEALWSGPRTLVHHDVHPGNIYWQGSEPGFLDWHLVRIGEGMGDVAYFLSTALDPTARREVEDRLVARYRHALAQHGVAAPGLAVLRARYRAHLVYPFEAMVATLAVGGMMDRRSNLEMIRRAAVAAEEHEAFAAALAGARGGEGVPTMEAARLRAPAPPVAPIADAPAPELG
jgi:aminoglycoside phosphotransferase (APT) family kinase protein